MTIQTEQDDVVVDDRRTAIEAAFEATDVVQNESPSDSSTPAAVTAPSQDETAAPSDGNPAPVATPPVAVTPPPTDTPVEQFAVDKAPQSWRPAQKAKWAALDPDVRQEVVRREREITRTLGETAEARQTHSRFHEVLTPYKSRIEAVNLDPIQVFSELMQSDHILSTANPSDKADYLADLIKYYKVDIQQLDRALAESVQASDPVEERVQQLLKEQLAPFQQFMQSQEQQKQAQEAQLRETNRQTIDAMAADEVKYPYFLDMKENMADIIELQAKKGVYLTLDQAYTRAIAMNPSTTSPVAAAAPASNNSAQLANARAQKALKASVSVGGAPAAVSAKVPDATDRRATIAAALDESNGR